MATSATSAIERPLGVGELFAAVIRIFSSRAWAFVVPGVLEAGAVVVQAVIPLPPAIAVLALVFAACFAVTVRLVCGDSLREALRRAAGASPVLVVLAFVVAVPFYLAASWLVLLVFSVLWLGLTCFAIPVAMVEAGADLGVFETLAYALRRTRTLSAVEYWHAVGVAAALVVVYVVFGIAVAGSLSAIADNGQVAALALAQVPLAPFFFIGLSVLYFDQRARAVESAGQPRTRR